MFLPAFALAIAYACLLFVIYESPLGEGVACGFATGLGAGALFVAVYALT
jgi:hypothetical protein